MAAPTPYFVDPLAGVDFATGGTTLLDPYLTVQFCIDDITTSHGGRDAVNGDQINVKSDQEPGVTTTTDDVTLAVIDLATVGAVYGAPAVDAPLIFRGYSYVANDGGIGGMDGNAGAWSIYDGNAGATDYVHFIHMHLHNTAGATIASLRNWSTVIGSELDTATVRAMFGGTYSLVANCHIHDVGGHAIEISTSATAVGNYIESGGLACVFTQGVNCVVERNILIATAVGTAGVIISADLPQIVGNSILSTGLSVDAGIRFDAVAHHSARITGNLIEGFSGGAGIDFFNQTNHVNLYANNSFYDNETDELQRGDFNYDEDNDLIMAASPFLKVGAMTYANRYGYFAPAIPVRGRAFPNGCQFDRGAAQVRLVTERTVAERCIITIPERIAYDPI